MLYSLAAIVSQDVSRGMENLEFYI